MRTLLFLLLATSIASCVRVNRDPVTGNADVDVESPLQRGEVWNANLTGRGSYASIGGTARLTAGGQEVTAAVSVTGAPAGGYHPWHVHEGTCATDGSIVGSPSAYSPLSIGSDRTAQATARLGGVKLNEASKYHVNVHLSPSQMGTVIACGDLDD